MEANFTWQSTFIGVNGVFPTLIENSWSMVIYLAIRLNSRGRSLVTSRFFMTGYVCEIGLKEDSPEDGLRPSSGSLRLPVVDVSMT